MNTQAPMMWIDIITLRSRVTKKASKIAKRNCALPMHKSRGAFLQILDKDGKQLISSDAMCFPMSGKDWKMMVPILKEKFPKAHTLHLKIIIDSASGWRSYEAGDIKHNTGEAAELVHTY
ncbi:MAG: hypothetical protein ACRCUF_20735 [Aeromonas sobria]